jgi:hypothetical protein
VESELILGSSSAGLAVDSLVLFLIVLVLVVRMLRGSVGLSHMAGQEESSGRPSRGTIAWNSTLVGMAMKGDYMSRMEIARTLRVSLACVGGETPRMGEHSFSWDQSLDGAEGLVDGSISTILSPVRPDRAAKRGKASKQAKEEYLRSLEGAVKKVGGLSIGNGA